ncbi:hypothetical protein LTR78_010412 [Recurvomyces mirabilis]|uniref:endo-1,3(4)-beta-glucanase n=1 Tax=Recurvomyces mirabilis TaxID=574656 RepID=A0AAE0WG84_9PEZI|nr:hypothetical protein LTR78_010412 [Recurvomyces mirabilis]KAK4551738.1 hypothetical protein LTR86_010931 [Recurvomyces mirabilis]KAK5149753.1 hypothetical protein LTS14_010674 [Recurvomyces mirabilis]
MRSSALFLSLAALAEVGKARPPVYTLEDDYEPANFFDYFTFFNTSDPTHGFVQYVNQSAAKATGLIANDKSTVYIGADHSNITPNGRPSVRITSKKAYNRFLLVLDLEHMPFGCGTWPAFWTVGPNWPNNGEIDIIEGVHTNPTDAMTLHTSDSCGITNDGAFSGTILTPNCYVAAPGQGNNAGCGIATTNNETYGAGLNAIGGGVYATEWNSTDITIWFFPRGNIPKDLTHGQHPDPATWGEPLSQFQGACDIEAHFADQQIVFDDTFCGDWAGNVWYPSLYPSCTAQAATCTDFVANNPDAFADAYWSINSLKVYQQTSDWHTPGHAPWGVDPYLPKSISSLCPIPTASMG